jgi:AraC family transcriptional regulator
MLPGSTHYPSDMSLRGCPTHPLSQTLFRSDLVEMGLFDCPRSHPLFHNSGPVRHYLVVFPRQAVRIRYTASEPVVASRQIITLYNDRQEYRREGLSKYGDQSFWLRFRKQEVLEALAANGKSHDREEETPFAWTHGHCDDQTYMLQKRLSCALSGPGSKDFLQITETALALLQRAINNTEAASFLGRNSARALGTQARHRNLASRCQALLSTNYHEALTLETMAQHLNTTPFHLSRVFSAQSGISIHQYLLQLRLRAAMDRMIESPGSRLTDIAEDLGFSSPSHFSHAFSKRFSMGPRQFRMQLN